MNQESLEIRAKDCLLDEADESQISERSAKNPGMIALSQIIKKYEIMEGWNNNNNNGVSHESTASSERIFQNTRRSYSMIGKREISRKTSLRTSQQNAYYNGNNDEGKENIDRPTVRILSLKFSHVLPGELKQEKIHNQQQLIQRIKPKNMINSQKELIPCVDSLIDACLENKQQHLNLKQFARRQSKISQDSFGISYSPPGLPQITQSNQLNNRNSNGKILGLFSLAQQHRKRSISQLVPDKINDDGFDYAYRNNILQNSCNSSRDYSSNKMKQTNTTTTVAAVYSNYPKCYSKPPIITRRESDDLLLDETKDDTRRQIASSRTSTRTQLSSQSQRQFQQQLKILKSASPRTLLRKELNVKKETSSEPRPFSSSMADDQIFKSAQGATQQHLRELHHRNSKQNISNYTPLPQIIRQLQDSKKKSSKLDEIDLSIKQRIQQHKQIMSGIKQEQQLIDRTNSRFDQSNKSNMLQLQNKRYL